MNLYPRRRLPHLFAIANGGVHNKLILLPLSASLVNLAFPRIATAFGHLGLFCRFQDYHYYFEPELITYAAFSLMLNAHPKNISCSKFMCVR